MLQEYRTYAYTKDSLNMLETVAKVGDDLIYDIVERVFTYTAIVGTAICGIYGATHITTAERSLPRNGRSHGGIWNKNDRTLGYYGKDGKLRYSIAFNNHKSPNIHNIPHWHTEMPHSAPINNVLKFIWEFIRKGF